MQTHMRRICKLKNLRAFFCAKHANVNLILCKHCQRICDFVNCIKTVKRMHYWQNRGKIMNNDFEDANKYSFFGLLGDCFNIEAVCPRYLPESQCSFTWQRDEYGYAVVSGYDP